MRKVVSDFAKDDLVSFIHLMYPRTSKYYDDVLLTLEDFRKKRLIKIRGYKNDTL